MDLPFELFIAVRYLLARRKQAFISAISLISALGVAVGVMALLIVLALMTGLQGELRDRIVGSAAHVYVLKHGGLGDTEEEIKKLLTVPRVVAAAPVVLGLGLAKSAGGSQFISIKGVDPVLERGVTNVEASMKAGSLDALTPATGTMAGIVLGKDLADKLGVGVDDGLEVMTPEGDLTPFGVSPRTRVFKVVGVFSLGLYEYDSSYGFVHLTVAERLLDRSRPDLIEVKVDDLFAAREVAEAIPVRLGSEYDAQDWADLNKSLFSALWLEKMAMSITIGLIVMVAALNIIASLVLLVMEKTRDIAILRTMGARASTIRRIFVCQGLAIGLIGTLTGAALGVVVSLLADRYQVIKMPSDVYQITYLPFRVQAFDVAIVVAAAIAICLVATLYPSRQAGRIDPAEALRNQ
jgi:lipoprotein-releasing system permease protein